ncbi:MAG TPA: hypothetical protein VN698_16430 [Bacteroidia bacterium]|nr:hypothetical protein [Bacteroidia bacterium]
MEDELEKLLNDESFRKEIKKVTDDILCFGVGVYKASVENDKVKIEHVDPMDEDLKQPNE